MGGNGSEKCTVYYTLHMTSMSSPFYTSCTVDTTQNIAMWPEINLQNYEELGSKSVCVRVWEHDGTTEPANNGESCTKTAAAAGDNGISHSNNADRSLFLWGVYFSGLVEIPNRTTVKLNDNTLIFQMHGGLFTSAEYLRGDDDNRRVPKEELPNYKAIIQTQNCDDNRLVVGTNSRLMWNANSVVAPSSSPPIKKSTMEATMTTAVVNQQKMVPEFDRKRAAPFQPRIRYIFKEFLTTEIRPSYDLKKLLSLQELQRWRKNKTENADELKEKICMKSAFCLNLELIANKSGHYRHYQLQKQKPSGLGRTLDRLLYQQNEPPSPDILMRAQGIRRDIEIAKFRCRLLLQERDNTKVAIRHLESRSSRTADANAEMGSWVMSNYRCLGRDRDLAVQERLAYAGKKEVLATLKVSLQLRRFQLLRELNEIYVVERQDRHYTINGIYLPDAESYSEIISSSDLSVALGYVAHVVLLCSIVLNIPLRFVRLY